MVNVHVAGRGPRSAIVRALPGSAGSSTSRVGNDAGAITLEDRLAGVACAGDGDPVGEQVAGVAVLRALSLDGEAGKESIGTAGRGNIGGSALLHGRSGSESGDGRDNEDGLHDCNGRAVDARWTRQGWGEAEATRHSLLKLRLSTLFIPRSITLHTINTVPIPTIRTALRPMITMPTNEHRDKDHAALTWKPLRLC